MNDGFHDIADVLDRVYREQDALDAADEARPDGPSFSLPDAA